MDSPKLDKFAIAQRLRDIAALLEIKGENKFRAGAYAKAASALEGLTDDLGTLIAQSRLTAIRNIGSSSAGIIGELYETGSAKLLEELKAGFPEGILELSQIPGLSSKKIETLHELLGVNSIEDLKKACKANAVRHVKGFSEKSEQTLLDAIDKFQSRRKRMLLVDALEIASSLLEHLHLASCVAEAVLVGAIARWEESVESIDIVAAGEADAVFERFKMLPHLSAVERDGTNRASGRTPDHSLPVNIFICRPAEFIMTAHHYSGDAAYSRRLAQIAQERGFQLTENRLTERGVELHPANEHAVYEHLALPYIPVELREGVEIFDEVLLGTTFDDLIEIDDIRGMTHCHSTFSDGVASIDVMVAAAKSMHKEYITITDHSPSAHYANGLPASRLTEQWSQVANAQSQHGIQVFRGTESDILGDGSLDYPADILSQLDLIIASIHSRMKMNEEQMTARLINCMRQPQFKIWGHALGRLVLKREPIPCRVEEVIKVASASRVAIEVNGDPHRLDMEPKWLRVARKQGMRFVISTDAHSVSDLRNLKFGVHLARRAGMRKSEVLNALSAEQFRQAVKP